jgi:gas vesicle protein
MSSEAGDPGAERLEYTRHEEVRGVNKQRLGTFVLGGIAGALAGILLAPKSGKELRGSISSRAGEARERGRETYFEAQERMQEHVSRAREYPSSEPEEESLANLGPATPDPILEEPPPLREVGSPDTDDIRRRIQETRSRLRARLESPEEERDE